MITNEMNWELFR